MELQELPALLAACVVAGAVRPGRSVPATSGGPASRGGPGAKGGGRKRLQRQRQQIRMRSTGNLPVALNAQLLDAKSRRAGLEIEQSRGAVGAFDHSACLPEHGDDVLSFDLFERLHGNSFSRRHRGRSARGLGARCASGRELLARRPQLPIDDELIAAREHDGALDRVLQLAHVPGPGVRYEQLAASVRCDARRCACRASRALRREEEVAPSAGMSSRRSRSGGTCEREHVQPVVQVRRGSGPARRSRLQIAVRRRDHAHVDLERPRAADALELLLLQHAQQLRLHLERQLADLVEEQRAAVGELEAADAAARSRR